MTILALEFSSEQRSVAAARDGRLLAEAAESGGYRVTNAFSLITQVLAKAHITRDAIEVLAVGLGPGSYTGIRAAIAIAQGWKLASGIKLLGVSSAEAMAKEAQAQNLFGEVNVVIDAQRGEFYLATWEISETSLRELAPLKIVTRPEMESRQAAGGIWIGPEQGQKMLPSAAMLTRLAAQRRDFQPGEKLEPIYLRETTFVKAPPARH